MIKRTFFREKRLWTNFTFVLSSEVVVNDAVRARYSCVGNGGSGIRVIPVLRPVRGRGEEGGVVHNDGSIVLDVALAVIELQRGAVRHIVLEFINLRDGTKIGRMYYKKGSLSGTLNLKKVY